MRDWIIIFLCVFLVHSPAYSWYGPHIAGISDDGGGGAAPACGSDTYVGNPGETETLECGAGSFQTDAFTESDNDGIINTYDNTQFKNGGRSLSFAHPGDGSDNDCTVTIDLGATDNDMSHDFWIRFPEVVDYQWYAFLNATVDSSPTSTSYAYRLRHLHDGSGDFKIVADGSADDTSTELTCDTWYRIEVDYDQNATSYVRIYNSGDSLVDTLTFTARNYAVRYIHVGNFDAAGDADAEGTAYYDDFRHKTGGGTF